MNLILRGKPEKSTIVYSIKPRNIGEEVRVYDNGKVVQTGEITEDLSTYPIYQNLKKRVGGKDVLFNSGVGYYKVDFK